MKPNRSGASAGGEFHGGALRTGYDGAGRSMQNDLGHIDFGPFLRQEGRHPARNGSFEQSHLRSQSQRISRPFGARQGSPMAGMTRLQSGIACQSGHLRGMPEITLWVSWLLQRIRRPE